MAKARAAINLADYGIAGLRPKRAITGGLILEVPGENGAERADALAKAMSALFAEDETRVSRPVKTAEVRIKGLEDSVSPEEMTAALAIAGGCTQREVKVGPVKLAPSGLGAVWARCPVSAVRRLADLGKITVG
ncbi:uncharacterized protein LOC109861820 [Pseudomyrmex gracilis]|uniref:uncharacterized protein LOC109861820 n=1 Tax=Pseudomyrmex gracilis TaxID=219809 RepID=UPI000994AD92|nr:uncharacterized protein LOC109861820 [Pseudomyrmex gracilis]